MNSYIWNHWGLLSFHSFINCLRTRGVEAHKLTQFTLSALELGCAVADEGVALAHTCAPVVAGQTAAVLRQR